MFVTLFELVKLERGTHQPWWGKREGNHFANKWQLFVPFEHGTYLHIISFNWVFSWFSWRSTFMSHFNPLNLSKECIVHYRTVCLSGLVMLPSLLSCHPMFKGRKKFTSAIKTTSVSVLFESVLWLLHSHHSRNFVPSFVSSMWDSSWTSFNEIIHVDVRSSSRN